MSIDTTVYVHDITLNLLNEACTLISATRNQLIVILFKKAMMDWKGRITTGAAIRYQARDDKKKWHTVHVRFREDEVDYVKDLRNFLKQSDSLILAQAVRVYIADIVKRSERKENIDNYPFLNYILSYDVIDGLIFWRICWGFPQNPEKYYPHCLME